MQYWAQAWKFTCPHVPTVLRKGLFKAGHPTLWHPTLLKLIFFLIYPCWILEGV
jgi:hypothetical protein